MDEAETLCDRVAIVDRGRVIALGTPRELVASLGAEHVVEFASRTRYGRRRSRSWSAGRRPRRRASEEGQVPSAPPKSTSRCPALLAALDARGAVLTALATHSATLEDVFVSLTGRHLRDAE